jgi:starvation-inducible DNA-binding protein
MKTGDRQEMATGLTGLLADTYMLYNTTQFYHWNIEGPQFHSLHQMFEEQYHELAEAVDLIAERIRVLGFYTPGTLPEFERISRLTQTENDRDSGDMLRHLVTGHQQIVHRIRDLQTSAERILDEATADLLVERLRWHEKRIWMLRSQAGGPSEAITVEEFARAGGTP